MLFSKPFGCNGDKGPRSLREGLSLHQPGLSSTALWVSASEWSRSVSDSATPRTVAYQAPPSMGFSRQEYWSGLPFPSPGDLPDPGIEPRSPAFSDGKTLHRLSHQGSPALLLLLSHFSRVQLCATPYMAAHQAPPSLGFSRQEHWSGLPFPSKMHESEKWKWSLSVVSVS